MENVTRIGPILINLAKIGRNSVAFFDFDTKLKIVTITGHCINFFLISVPKILKKIRQKT